MQDNKVIEKWIQRDVTHQCTSKKCSVDTRNSNTPTQVNKVLEKWI